MEGKILLYFPPSLLSIIASKYAYMNGGVAQLMLYTTVTDRTYVTGNVTEPHPL